MIRRWTGPALTAAALLIFNLMNGAPSVGGAGLAVLILGAAALELLAVRTLEIGLFSSAAAFYLAAAAVPACGPSLAASMAGLFLLLRAALKGGTGIDVRAAEAVSDLLPLMVAIAVVPHVPLQQPFPLAAAILLYLVLAPVAARHLGTDLPRPELLRWHQLQSLVLPLRCGVGLAAGAVAVLVLESPPQALWMVVPLWGLHFAAENAVFGAQARSVAGVHQELERSREALDRTRDHLGETRRELQVAQSERNLVEGFARHLAASSDLGEVLDLILDAAGGLAPSRSIAVFSAEEKGLIPIRYRSPAAQTLDSAVLLKLHEPLVLQAWKRRSIQQLEGGPGEEPRIFEGEEQAVALPLGSEGVLYVGRAGADPYSPEQLHFLTQIAAKAGLALQSSRRQAAQRRALLLHSEANLELRQSVTSLGHLLDGARTLVSTLDDERLSEELRELLGFIPHDFGVIASAGNARCWGVPTEEQDRHALAELVQTVSQNRQPLLIGDFSQTRLSPPSERWASLLAAPMLTEQGVEGVLALGARRREAFTREHQDLLFLCAFLAAGALANARLFRAVVEARKLLEESQAQLIQSTKMAAVGQLAAGVAHELNSPLAAITLALDGAEARLEQKPASAASKIQRARKAAGRAKKIIEKLLFYSRHSGSAAALIEPARLAEDTVAFLEHQLALDGIEILTDLRPAGCVQGSLNELQQVLVNLILNARDATLAAGRDRRIRVFTAERDSEVAMGVQDWGTGILPDHLERVFEPFFTT
ncbi:MAG: GAF domain-containing protein [Armatimonadetes bacterium]|nr:GAF domain-containing protein [Armatimonadota bacterium]